MQNAHALAHCVEMQQKHLECPGEGGVCMVVSWLSVVFSQAMPSWTGSQVGSSFVCINRLLHIAAGALQMEELAHVMICCVLQNSQFWSLQVLFSHGLCVPEVLLDIDMNIFEQCILPIERRQMLRK